MMQAQHRDIRERGEPLAALWASEETIYGRFGYGLSLLQLMLRGDRHHLGLRAGLHEREGCVRMIDHDEALQTLPRLYDRVRRSQPGFLSRSREWWELRKLDDSPDRRRGGGPLHRVVFEVDGRPAGYALYRVVSNLVGDEWQKTLRVVEAVGVDARATREIWRFLLSIDWMDELEAWLLPLDHPLLHIVARVNMLRSKVGDGLWLRLLDVGAALSARRYAGDGRLTLELVSDPLFPDNAGTWTIEGGRARQTSRRPDVRLDVQTLGAAFLGGFTFDQLARAERVEEVARGGLLRADALFRVRRATLVPGDLLVSGRLAGKTAVITGACGGIGRVACRSFCAEGASVLGVDLDAGGRGRGWQTSSAPTDWTSSSAAVTSRRPATWRPSRSVRGRSSAVWTSSTTTRE